ncbi:uncharacterized protein LOC108670253 [Hyalella azteca]|uniref:Uncharacterized protein LOC108670253 n=1 Tax=Hyalella azteca TaxID=294128 RepID=A0A8B7NHT4_HYAAZ|nr:uncharacterized protein LOC108670253 [Hyalella azteca]
MPRFFALRWQFFCAISFFISVLFMEQCEVTNLRNIATFWNFSIISPKSPPFSEVLGKNFDLPNHVDKNELDVKISMKDHSNTTENLDLASYRTTRQASKLSTTTAIDVSESPETLPWWERVNVTDCNELNSFKYKNARKFLPSTHNISNFKPIIGHCGYRASLLGDDQKVISYSVYGNDSDYFYGISFIMEDARILYPGWNIRIHTLPKEHYSFFCPLLMKYPNLALCDAENLPEPLGDVSMLNPMLWRSSPMGDPQVERFIVRDSDAKLSKREAAAVEQWISYRKPLHLLRDHPAHTAPIMGGMFGIWQPPPMLKIFEKIRQRLFVRNLNDDQYNLARAMPAGLLLHHSVQHSSYQCRLLGKALPFPTQRQDGIFVGNAMYKSQYRNVTSIMPRCPVACRPPEHQDWLYC